MLNKVFASINGYKTYILASLGIVVALIGHFWGPLTVGNTLIPQASWQDVWTAVQLSGLASTLRHAISKGSVTQGETNGSSDAGQIGS